MNEFTPLPAGRKVPPAQIWWIIWGGILAGLVMIYAVLGRGPLPTSEPGANPLGYLVGVVPLFVSIILRWLVLPRAPRPGAAFVLFIVGLALAEACGILGIFLGGPYRDELFVLGVLGITQYVPLFAGQLLRRPGSNFHPNP